jgi:hypothetical protein
LGIVFMSGICAHGGAGMTRGPRSGT